MLHAPEGDLTIIIGYIISSLDRRKSKDTMGKLCPCDFVLICAQLVSLVWILEISRRIYNYDGLWRSFQELPGSNAELVIHRQHGDDV